MGRFRNPSFGFSSPVRADRKPRRNPVFAPEWLERKLSPSSLTVSAEFSTASTNFQVDDDVDPEDLPPGYPYPLPPTPPSGPAGPR